jgi:hypothetical protein
MRSSRRLCLVPHTCRFLGHVVELIVKAQIFTSSQAARQRDDQSDRRRIALAWVRSSANWRPTSGSASTQTNELAHQPSAACYALATRAALLNFTFWLNSLAIVLGTPAHYRPIVCIRMPPSSNHCAMARQRVLKGRRKQPYVGDASRAQSHHRKTRISSYSQYQ